VVPCNVLCLLHLPDQQRVVCGCEDGTIRLHTLDARLPPVGASQCSSGQQQREQQQSSSGAAQQARDAGGGLLPTVWTGVCSRGLLSLLPATAHTQLVGMRLSVSRRHSDADPTMFAA
jgi:hypothetical protein